MQVYFARQPILNQNLQLYGYELLFRHSPQSLGAQPIEDGDAATAAVIEGIQARGLMSITRGKKAFINFTHNLLINGVAAYFPPESIVVEVLETAEPTARLLDALAALKAKGYMVALDDFSYREDLVPLIKLADIIKIDFLDPAYMRNIYQIRTHIDPEKCTLLAEKVESRAVFESAYEHGCRLFQGYFFAMPASATEKTVGVMRFNSMRLIAAVNRKEVDFNQITDIVKQDVGLSYRVLRLVNSAYFGARREITDLKTAIVFLGHNELRKWCSFVALFSLSENKPPELFEMSLVRARFCEIVAAELGMPQEAFFLGGLFSLLDAMLDTPIEDTIADVMLPEIAHAALCGEPGALRDTLDLNMAVERGNWESVTRICDTLGLDEVILSKLYADALQWTSELYGEEAV
jgi:EAL and modified HD-GYP domain-containing signal transduction protein